MLVEVIMAENRQESEQVLDSLLQSLENAANTIKGSSKKPLTTTQLAQMKELQSKLRNIKIAIDDYFTTDTVQQKLTDITQDKVNKYNNTTKDRAAISNFFF